ncbi:MAG: TolC family protein [Opitutae bacterium]|nr:TolC family protein [Opitutae bacterium]
MRCLALWLSLSVAASLIAQEGPPPLTLEQAIQRALAHNYAIQVQAVERPIARAALSEAWGKFDVRLTGSFYASRDEQPRLPNALTGYRSPSSITQDTTASLALGGSLPWGMSYSLGANTENARGTSNNFVDTYATFAGLALTQPLLRDAGFGPTLTQIRLARTNAAMSEWDYRQAVTNIVTQVIYAYSDLYYAQLRLRSAQRSRDLAAQLHKDNARRYEVQAMSEFDVLSANARVATREDSVLQAEYGLRTAENALRQLISDERQPALLTAAIEIEPLPTLTRAAPDPAADFAVALQQRPDYRLAQLAIQRGDLNRRAARNQLLPRIDATGSYGYNGIGPDFIASRQDARAREATAYSAGVSVSLPLTSTAERSRYRASKLRLHQAELELQQLEQAIVVSLGNAAQLVESTRRRMDVSRESRQLNESMLQAELKRLRAGSGSTFNVLYQQEQLSAAETNEAAAQVAHCRALAEYDRQTGRTLEVHRIVIRSD